MEREDELLNGASINRAKAKFFGSQVNEPWAASEFGVEEMAGIGRMLRYADLRAGNRIIEPGCGTGRLTEMLADVVGPTGLVLAFDISPEMIHAARRRIGSRDNVSLRCGCIEAYAFAPGAYDVVVCHNVFPHFDHKLKSVSHLASALIPGGKFIVFHFMNSAGINDLHRKADPSVLNDVLPSESEMREIFRAAGLAMELLIDDDSGYLLTATRT